MRFGSTAADSDDDLQAVPVREYLLREPAARHDFSVALERDPFARKLELCKQLSTVDCLLEVARFAVDRNGYH